MNSFAEKIKNFFLPAKDLSEGLFDDFCDLLIEGDFGARAAYKITENLKANCKKIKDCDGDTVRKILSGLLEELITKNCPEIVPFPPPDQKLSILLLLGVNGTGKTTTAAKIAKRCLDMGKHPILAAGDTFRAAAIDQIKIHGERLGVRVVSHKHGGDPAAVIFDSIDAAQSGGGDVIIADTAGRMHTKASLMEELKKIGRIIESKANGASFVKYLVLDATTGRNALSQAEIFNEAVKLDGYVLTKTDSSAKGGVVFSLAEDFGLSAVFLCSGENYADIKLFNPKDYCDAFAALS